VLVELLDLKDQLAASLTSGAEVPFEDDGNWEF